MQQENYCILKKLLEISKRDDKIPATETKL